MATQYGISPRLNLLADEYIAGSASAEAIRELRLSITTNDWLVLEAAKERIEIAKIINVWQLVAESRGNDENSTYRMRIQDGWIYRYGSNMVFVPK